MAHTFTIKPCDEIPAALGRVRQTMAGLGWSLAGDEESGNFSGNTPLGFIRGNYFCTADKEIIVEIIDKPILIPYGMIESTIREYFVSEEGD